ncbi:MAG: hypothetical protein JXR14_09720 [Paracoccaceae bacterium]
MPDSDDLFDENADAHTPADTQDMGSNQIGGDGVSVEKAEVVPKLDEGTRPDEQEADPNHPNLDDPKNFEVTFPLLLQAAKYVLAKGQQKANKPDTRKSLEDISDGLGGLKALLNSTTPAVIKLRMQEFVDAIALPCDADDETRAAVEQDALEMLFSFAPNDPVERMLASHLVATHRALMKCFHDAGDQDASPQLRDMSLRHAERLMASFEKQHAALLKNKARYGDKDRVEEMTAQESKELAIKIWSFLHMAEKQLQLEQDAQKKHNSDES